MKNIVLVDFTSGSENSIIYAIEFVKKINESSIELVNVSDISDYSASVEKLRALKDQYSSGDFKVEIAELSGELLDVLPEYLNQQNVGFVFCGTHDLKFLDRYFSSRSMKLMQKSDSNFIFIPESLGVAKPINHVLVPILSDKHSLQNLEPLLFLRHFMNFEITLCTYKDKADGHEQILYVATKILNEAAVPFNIEYVGSTEQELLENLEEVANSCKANAISIVDFTEDHIFNFGSRGIVERLIRNEYSLPIIAIQNVQLEHYDGFSASGG